MFRMLPIEFFQGRFTLRRELDVPKFGRNTFPNFRSWAVGVITITRSNPVLDMLR